MMETSAGDLRRNLIDQPQTVSQAFNLGSKTAIQNVIDELDLQAAKRVQSGFNEVTFTLGVLNCFLILFIFGNFPQHFWLLYIIESAFFIPTRFMQMSRAIPNQAFYYFDLCWIMNFCGVAALLIMMFGRNLLSEHFIRILLFASFGIACGPLLGANIALSFVALIFHDVSSMTSVFIHIYPPVLMYVMRWKSEAVTDAWPNKFELNYDVNFFPSAEGSFVDSVFGATTIVYFVWFVAYTTWQLSVGLNLPKNGGRFDTVFHSTMRGGLCIQMGKILWKRPVELSKDQMKTNNFEMRDFAAYSIFHAISSIGSLLVLGYPCTLSSYAHGIFLVICLVISTWRGAQRYTYYSTQMYSNLIRKQFATDLHGEKPPNSNGHEDGNKKCT